MNKYAYHPYKLYCDLCEAAELIETDFPEEVCFAEVLSAIAGKFSEEGTTHEQNNFLNAIKELYTKRITSL